MQTSAHTVLEAAAKVLIEREKQFYAKYPFCSTLPFSENEIVSEVGKQMEKEIEVKTPSFERAVELFLGSLFTSSGKP
ncbi:Uu.00g052330.m01.CDS01 [Anthostomella pinea]|uniref:Uu.00g052330.m01.CDS01 n=1 Tax=Anthostomella pinea TaxID=933095 RepID=A0AAI8VW95_9PEZI|nr:Uu.00g052330.m01.CDS01 [Anthostomella pinea]